jgi:2,4-didehydro-3-deoxy-L-rhamnonate hydrolase
MAKFTLATLNTKDGARAAIGVGDGYYQLGLAQPPLPDLTVRRILETWETSLPVLEVLSSELTAGKVHATKIAAASADLLTPVRYPDALLAVGANYSGHLKEMGLQVTKWASMPFFLRPPITTLVGPGETVRLPRSTKQFDWECELAVFVSKRLRHASREEAASAIARRSHPLCRRVQSWSRKMQPCSTGRLRPAASSALSGLAPPSLPFASPSRIVRSMPRSLSKACYEN